MKFLSRGVSYDPSKPYANLILAWGTQPKKTVTGDTTMIDDFFATLKDRYDLQSLEVSFPEVLKNLKMSGSDNWEIFVSN